MPEDIAATANGQEHFGCQENIGQRKEMEDRSNVDIVTTANGVELTVAMVADGIGGAAHGERAATVAIEVTFHEIEAAELSEPEQIPELLESALIAANDAIYRESRREREKRGMGSTATIVVIHQDNLYLANVGDSRAYLIHEDALQQISRDHNWADEMTRKGLISAEEVANHPKANELTRSLGYDLELEVDLGIYHNGIEDESVAREQQGLELVVNDRILVCSDGLIKERYSGNGHFVENSEIVSAVTRRPPQEAANDLVKKAMKRHADDNVSAIVIEVPGSKRRRNILPAVWYAIGFTVLIALIAAAFFVTSNRDVAAENTLVLSTDSDMATTQAIVQTTEPIHNTPTSTQTVPSSFVLVETAGTDGRWDSGEGLRTVSNDLNIPLRVGVPLRIMSGTGNTTLTLLDGSQIILDGKTDIKIDEAADFVRGGSTAIELTSGKVLVVTGANTVRVGNQFGSYLQVTNPPEGSLVGAINQDDPFRFEADCLLGTECALVGDLGGSSIFLSPGEYGFVGGAGEPTRDGGARFDLYGSLAPTLIPTPTLTPTSTSTPTETPTPTATYTAISPTETPTPTPTRVLDRDGDGVPDADDLCKDWPGAAEDNGCPRRGNNTGNSNEGGCSEDDPDNCN